MESLNLVSKLRSYLRVLRKGVFKRNECLGKFIFQQCIEEISQLVSKLVIEFGLIDYFLDSDSNRKYER